MAAVPELTTKPAEAPERPSFKEQQPAHQDEQAERLAHNPTVQEIGRAYASSDNGPAFVQALQDKDILLARVTKIEALESQHRQEAARTHGHFRLAYEEGQYLALNKRGQVFQLDTTTLHDQAEKIAARLEQIDASPQLTLTQAKEVMAFWRGSDDKPAREPSGPTLAAPAIGKVASATLGGAVRVAEFSFHVLGDVLDYFFGGASPQQQRPAPVAHARHDRARSAPEPPQETLRRADRTTALSDPNTQHLLRTAAGTTDADLLAEIRRQMEQRERDNSRSR